MASRPRLLIDCDPGLDDAVMLVCARAFGEVRAITTVAGNVDVDRCTTNALTVTALLGWDVPVHEGAGTALAAPAKEVRAQVHGPSGMDGVTVPSSLVLPVARPESAVEVIIDNSRAEEGLWLLATGPLTNVALAMRHDPGLTSRLAGISWMGGSAGSGNITAAAEFNCFVDPEAASEVVATARCPVFMSGLDVTNQFTVDESLIAELESRSGPAAQLVCEIARRYLATYGQFANAVALPPLHDPVALFVITHPELFDIVATGIAIELDGTHTRGASVVERRLVHPTGTAPTSTRTRWVRAIDAAAARRLLIDAVDQRIEPDQIRR